MDRENARLFFPTAIQILDFYHAVEHLGVLDRALFGEGSFGVEQQSARAGELKRGGAAAIIDQTSRLLQTLPDIGIERLRSRNGKSPTSSPIGNAPAMATSVR